MGFRSRLTGARRASAETDDGIDVSNWRGKRAKVAHMVAEGLYIAAAATRLAVKNRILVQTLSSDEPFRGEEYVPFARETLLSLADEADQEARHVQRELRGARGRYTRSRGTHDYRDDDVGNLKRRKKLAEHTSQELRQRAESTEELLELIEAARAAAWDEIAANIDRRLQIEAARPDLESDYARMRQARIDALRQVDLPRLAASQRRKQRGSGRWLKR